MTTYHDGAAHGPLHNARESVRNARTHSDSAGAAYLSDDRGRLLADHAECGHADGREDAGGHGHALHNAHSARHGAFVHQRGLLLGLVRAGGGAEAHSLPRTHSDSIGGPRSVLGTQNSAIARLCSGAQQTRAVATEHLGLGFDWWLTRILDFV